MTKQQTAEAVHTQYIYKIKKAEEKAVYLSSKEINISKNKDRLFLK